MVKNSIYTKTKYVDNFVDDFVDDFTDDFADFAPEEAAAPESYDCNILPTSRSELALYQQFCG